MSETMAVLSYTRKDDEFFGGYITAFRKTLESAVHVVTGLETFRIFQDVEASSSASGGRRSSLR
jgi:hypothetical protein